MRTRERAGNSTSWQLEFDGKNELFFTAPIETSDAADRLERGVVELRIAATGGDAGRTHGSVGIHCHQQQHFPLMSGLNRGLRINNELGKLLYQPVFLL